MNRLGATSVVIPTFDRIESCRNAARSALAQRPAPFEVIIADDGSRDETQRVMRRWVSVEPRLRYVRLGQNSGLPAVARNAGIEAARGEWIAFLDDDDEWLPGKLAAQGSLMDAGYDVVCTDALRSSGLPYFGLSGGSIEIQPRSLSAVNRIITSTAVVRRALLDEVGGLPTEPWARGVEDYALWLLLSDAGARFAIIATPYVIYEDATLDRLSTRSAQQEAAALRVVWGHWRRRPRDPARVIGLLRRTVAQGVLLGRLSVARIGARAHRWG